MGIEPVWSCNLGNLYRYLFPKKAPYKVWLLFAKRFQRRCLKKTIYIHAHGHGTGPVRTIGSKFYININLLSIWSFVSSYFRLNDLKCKNLPQIMNFWREFLTAGRQEKCFQFSSWISICCNRTCKNFENRSKTNVFMSEMNFE